MRERLGFGGYVPSSFYFAHLLSMLLFLFSLSCFFSLKQTRNEDEFVTQWSYIPEMEPHWTQYANIDIHIYMSYLFVRDSGKISLLVRNILFWRWWKELEDMEKDGRAAYFNSVIR
jgi:hypothetical protein